MKTPTHPVLIFDIETTRTSNAALIERIREKIKPPATLKKPESIQDWWNNQSGAAFEEKVAQTALNGLYGDVTAIGWHIAITETGEDADLTLVSFDGSEKPRICIRKNDQDVASFLGETYRMMEADIAKHYTFRGSYEVRIAGHNIIGFDLPFLKQQSLRYYVRHMRFFPYRKEFTVDTMVELAGYKEFISLQDAALCLSIPWDKTSIPGDQVPLAWEAGDHHLVRHHLENDVNVTAELTLRLMKGGFC